LTRDDGLEMVKSIIRSVEVEDEPSGGPKPVGNRGHCQAQLVRGEVVEAVEGADGGVEDTFDHRAIVRRNATSGPRRSRARASIASDASTPTTR
jgi:hypothetical protein